jgi:hypothetical protein
VAIARSANISIYLFISLYKTECCEIFMAVHSRVKVNLMVNTSKNSDCWKVFMKLQIIHEIAQISV